MPFKLKNVKEVFGFSKEHSNGDRLVKELPLPKDVMGQINPNGVIEIQENMTAQNKRRAVKHETEHLKQMRSGKLRFDHNNYYYKPTPFSKEQIIPVSKINTHNLNLPWEKDVYNKTKQYGKA